MVNKRKIAEYYRLKKAKDLLDKKVEDLNKEIKESLEPGVSDFEEFKAEIILRKKYEWDWDYLRMMRPDVWDQCSQTVIDPSLIESAYLRGDISDGLMKKIRGDAVFIPSLRVEKVEEDESVQTNI